jgi:gliding motility-associated-like protein
MKKIFLLNILALILVSFQMSAQCTIEVATIDITAETCVGSSDAFATAVAGGVAPVGYLWSNGQTTAIATDLTTGSYTVTATDAAGCTGTASAEITLDPEGIWLMFTSTPVTCNGGSDGTAYVSVMTGVAPYIYIWNDPAGTTNASPVNLAAGQYTVTVTDSNGCSNYGPVTVTEPTAIVIISSTTNETCFGDADGTASVSVSDGTPDYTYLWSNGQTIDTVNNLTAGDYTVTVTDANGCPSTATLTVDLTNPQIVISGISSPVTCFGGSDGSATVSVNSGNGPFLYSWSNAGNSATILNLIAGDYTVTVTGAEGCASITTVSVSEPPELTVTTTTTANVSCNGGSNGSITVSSNGGTGSVSYLWSNSGTSETISNLIVGTYTVTATDGNGCTATTSETITEPSELTATGSGTNVTVNGGNDGTAMVTASGGTLDYTYSWSDGQTGATAINLIAGTYTVTVTDANGCPPVIIIIIISEPPALAITSTPDTCGLTVGTATVIATGGTTGYTYLWSDGQITSMAAGLTAGIYTVTVTDAAGLSSFISTTVTEEGSTIIATTSHSDETCVGSSDGSLAVSTSGGVGQMTFLWSSGDTTFIVNNLSAGTYTVTVTDEIGCTASSIETIELSPEGIWVDIDVTPVSCFNGNDGSATAVVNTGVAPYIYAWNNGATTPTILSLTVGDYTVTVTDVNGCIGIFTTTVTEPTELIAITSSTDIICSISTGTATVSATGGTPTYTYEWSNGEITQDIDILGAGTYTATVTDDNGCTTVSSTTIMNTDLIIITVAESIPPSTVGAMDGSIDIEVSGGSNHTYEWSNGATTQDINTLAAGCYTVTVTDGAGVCETERTICIGNIGNCELIINVTTTNNDCDNDNIGIAIAAVSQNPNGCTDSMYTYYWTTVTGDSLGNTQGITGLVDGTYLVTVTNTEGLTVTGSGVVMGSGGITSSATGTNILCNGETTGTAIGNGIGGSLGYTYLWSNGETTPSIDTLAAGTYTVTVTDQSNTACTSLSQVTITEPPVITITASTSNPTTPGGSDGSINITVTGGTLGYTYLWSTGDTTQNITGLTEGCYTVMVTDANNCTTTAESCILSCLLTVTGTPESCNPGNDGTAMASVIGCTPPVSFVWENSAGVVVGITPMILGLTEGMYYVTATDANLETRNDSVQITFIEGPDANANSANVTCNSFTDGEVSATPTGGAVPYSYNWADSNGVIIGSTDTISSLSAGTYTVTVTDAVGCTDIAVVEILEDEPITLTQVITPLACFGDTDASIIVTPSGGVPIYTYQWSTSPTDMVDSITGLSPGVYTVTITDQNMCTKVASFMISEPPAITITTDPGTSICEDFLIVNATASAGATISWYNSGNVLIGMGSPFAYLSIPSGTSTIYAEADANGCKAVDSITIIQNAVDVSVTPSTSICLGDIFPLMATNNISSQDIDYVWTPTNLFVTGTNTLAAPTLIAFDTGIYEVYLSSTNQFNCEQFDTVTVSVQDTTTNFIIKQQCIGLEVNYTSTSGIAMIWNFGDGSPQDTAISTTHTYVAAGDYNIMMILPLGAPTAACLPDTVTQVIPVADDPIFNIDFTLNYDPCVEDGTTVYFSDISTNIFGSIDSVWWIWQGDTISTNPLDSMVITQSVMDSLTLYVMSEDGCMDSLSKEIEITVISVLLQDTIVVCSGTDTTLNPNGNPNYQYTWSPVPNGDPNEIDPMITATVSTSYSVTITDNSGANPCSIVKEVFVLVPTALIDLTTSPDTILCGIGMVTLSASSSSASDYNWYNEYPNDPILLNSATLDLSIGSTDAPQYYYVEALDENNCPTVDSIFAGNAEVLSLLDGEYEVCLGSEIIIQGGGTSNEQPLSYEWTDPNGTMVGMASTLAFSPTLEGLYTFEAYNDYCTAISSFNVNVINVSLDIEATADPEEAILGETIQLDVDHEMGPYTFLWSDTRNSILGDSTQRSPQAMPEEVGEYEYNVVVTDENNCTALSTVLVTISTFCDNPYVFFPNVFSPNGDGVNDVLQVESVVVDEVYFVIYNRWGEKVFEGNNVDSAWDGTHNGDPVSSDVYGYYLRAVCLGGEVYEEKGNVTVLR